MRVLNVRIDWHVKRPTNKKVKRRAVQSQAGEGLARRREQIKCTHLQLSGSARTAGSVVVFATPSDPIGFGKSTRDVEAQSAAKEHTSEARGLFVCKSFSSLLWTSQQNNRAKRAFFFLDSVTVNTVVHTESETCPKQWL